MARADELVRELSEQTRDQRATYGDLRTALAKLIALAQDATVRGAAEPAIRTAEGRLQRLAVNPR
jgi:hypothetical protein